MLDGSNFEPDTHEPIHPTPRGIFGWTEAAEEHLRRRWGSTGAAAAIIGKELGTSRNSVISKARRLGLRHPESDGCRVKAVRRSRAKPQVIQKQTQATILRHLQIDQDYEDVVAAASIPAAEPCSLIDLREDSCRWPIGLEAPYLFCNADQVDGLPYCVGHSRIAYTAPRPKGQFIPKRWRAA